MSLTFGEAQAVNTALKYFLRPEPKAKWDTVPTMTAARQAVRLLAYSAHKKLQGGMSEGDAVEAFEAAERRKADAV